MILVITNYSISLKYNLNKKLNLIIEIYTNLYQLYHYYLSYYKLYKC